MKKQPLLRRWAHVGAHHEPFGLFDSAHVEQALMQLLQRGARLARKPLRDIVNLEYGRDFLTEVWTYDIVLVHSVYAFGSPGAPSKYDLCKTSTFHTPERWRQRLAATKAEYILVAEMTQMCMSGYFIGELEGYKMLEQVRSSKHSHPDSFTVWQREGLNGSSR